MLGIDTSRKLLLLTVAQAIAIFVAAVCVTIAFVDYSALVDVTAGEHSADSSQYFYTALGPDDCRCRVDYRHFNSPDA